MKKNPFRKQSSTFYSPEGGEVDPASVTGERNSSTNGTTKGRLRNTFSTASRRATGVFSSNAGAPDPNNLIIEERADVVVGNTQGDERETASVAVSSNSFSSPVNFSGTVGEDNSLSLSDNDSLLTISGAFKWEYESAATLPNIEMGGVVTQGIEDTVKNDSKKRTTLRGTLNRFSTTASTARQRAATLFSTQKAVNPMTESLEMMSAPQEPSTITTVQDFIGFINQTIEDMKKEFGTYNEGDGDDIEDFEKLKSEILKIFQENEASSASLIDEKKKSEIFKILDESDLSVKSKSEFLLRILTSPIKESIKGLIKKDFIEKNKKLYWGGKKVTLLIEDYMKKNSMLLENKPSLRENLEAWKNNALSLKAIKAVFDDQTLTNVIKLEIARGIYTSISYTLIEDKDIPEKEKLFSNQGSEMVKSCLKEIFERLPSLVEEEKREIEIEREREKEAHKKLIKESVMSFSEIFGSNSNKCRIYNDINGEGIRQIEMLSKLMHAFLSMLDSEYLNDMDLLVSRADVENERVESKEFYNIIKLNGNDVFWVRHYDQSDLNFINNIKNGNLSLLEITKQSIDTIINMMIEGISRIPFGTRDSNEIIDVYTKCVEFLEKLLKLLEDIVCRILNIKEKLGFMLNPVIQSIENVLPLTKSILPGIQELLKENKNKTLTPVLEEVFVTVKKAWSGCAQKVTEAERKKDAESYAQLKTIKSDQTEQPRPDTPPEVIRLSRSSSLNQVD